MSVSLRNACAHKLNTNVKQPTASTLEGQRLQLNPDGRTASACPLSYLLCDVPLVLKPRFGGGVIRPRSIRPCEVFHELLQKVRMWMGLMVEMFQVRKE